MEASKTISLRSTRRPDMHSDAMHVRDAKTRDILSCLGDPSRFELALRLLERERCVSELATAVGLSQSCTTRHLQALSRLGVVQGNRDGKRVLFRLCLERPAVSELLDWATRSSPAGGAHLHADRNARLVRHAEPPPRPARHAKPGAGATPVAPVRVNPPAAPTPVNAETASSGAPHVEELQPGPRTVPASLAPMPPAVEEALKPRPVRRFQELEDFLL